MNPIPTITAQCMRYSAPSTWRLWLRGILKNALHNASGTMLAGLGTNGVEAMAPESIHPYVAGLSMSLSQCAAVFCVALALSTLTFVHKATAPGNSTPPI